MLLRSPHEMTALYVILCTFSHLQRAYLFGLDHIQALAAISTAPRDVLLHGKTRSLYKGVVGLSTVEEPMEM